MEARPKKLVHYIAGDDADPFADWMEEISGKVFDIVNIRLKRVANGNFGDAHGVGNGVSELVIDLGPGYRVYFGQDGDTVVLLTGGTKRTTIEGHCQSQSSLEGIQRCLSGREIIRRG